MTQLTFAEDDFARQQSKTLKTRKRVFLEQMDQVVPWSDLVSLIAPHAPIGRSAKGGRPPFSTETMLRIHFLQQWFNLSDPAMEDRCRSDRHQKQLGLEHDEHRGL